MLPDVDLVNPLLSKHSNWCRSGCASAFIANRRVEECCLFTDRMLRSGFLYPTCTREESEAEKWAASAAQQSFCHLKHNIQSFVLYVNHLLICSYFELYAIYVGVFHIATKVVFLEIAFPVKPPTRSFSLRISVFLSFFLSFLYLLNLPALQCKISLTFNVFKPKHLSKQRKEYVKSSHRFPHTTTHGPRVHTCAVHTSAHKPTFALYSLG